MTALVRYQFELLLRSHRWVGPLAVYAVFAWFTGGAGSQSLSAALSWTAAALLPVSAWLTRLLLTAEPAEARACLAAASGPRKAQLAALIAGLAASLVLGLGSVLLDLVTGKAPAGGADAYARTLLVGLAAAVICLSVGSAIGALCNPPVVRPVAYAVLSTVGVNPGQQRLASERGDPGRWRPAALLSVDGGFAADRGARRARRVLGPVSHPGRPPRFLTTPSPRRPRPGSARHRHGWTVTAVIAAWLDLYCSWAW